MVQSGEFGLINKIRQGFPPSKKGFIGIGDDAAVIEKNLLITTDALVEDYHFIKDKITPEDLGYKSMAVNISDIAAMGGYPLYALLTLGITDSVSDAYMDRLMRGMQAIRKEYPFELIGGDTVRSDSFFISITVIGKPFHKPLLRSGALEGDHIYVTGTVGDSAIGLEILLNKLQFPVEDPAYFLQRHSHPTPRVSFMEYITKRYQIHSAIDISDGLLADLGHIADESNLGFDVTADAIPVSKDKIGNSDSGDLWPWIQYGLSGGEDYEIILTSKNRIQGEKVFKDTGVRITRIGSMIKKGRNLNFEGKTIDYSSIKKGFSHF